MPKVTFFIRKNNDSVHSTVLYCRVTANSKTSEFSLREKVDPKDWNQQEQILKSKNKAQNSFVNTLIDSIRYKLKSNAIVSGSQSPKELIDSLKPKQERKQSATLYECVETYIKQIVEKSMSPGTIKTHYARLKNLKQFQEHSKQIFRIDPGTDSENFDLPTAEKFKAWYAQTKKTRNKSTASRNIEVYKKALQYAVKCGEIKSFDLSLYETERDTVKTPVFLSISEVKKLINAKFESAMLERVKDLYLFQIGTGLSYSDIWANWKIKQTENGTILKGTRSKNSQAFFVPLEAFALAILEKYNFELPRYENAVFNRVLKEVAGILGINKRLTTHSGRKTFATLMDQQGWSIESIAKMLGHSSIKTTETYYIGKSFVRVEKEMIERKKAMN